jgi:RNA binding exosome subunit
MSSHVYQPTNAQISRAAIQKLHVSMKHLFIRGSYKPLGISGETMITAMLSLKPEIYGSIDNEEVVELNGLLYIFQRLPRGIETCRYIKLISREGFEHSTFLPIIPSRRKRNCYRIDDEQMFIEMTRGGSDVYDILTHLTFMYIEAEKVRKHALDIKGRPNRAWTEIESIVKKVNDGEEISKEVGITYLSALIGRTFEETKAAVEKFEKSSKDVNSLFEVVYGLGKLSIEEHLNQLDREITFSPLLRMNLGHHIHGESWAKNIKKVIYNQGNIQKPIHIISANLHSVMNALFAQHVLREELNTDHIETIAEHLSKDSNEYLRNKVKDYAVKQGMVELADTSGTNIGVQIFNTSDFDPKSIQHFYNFNPDDGATIIVMDYAFGEQAFETMDELLKPFEINDQKIKLDIRSINIMGKAGILKGQKGDIMIPTAHIFEGTADNYPFENKLTPENFKNCGLLVTYGNMITVLGTSLQNKDVLNYFLKSSWQAIGLEMEGAHYQKAIQVASKIRHSINPNVSVRYAYYASDNPLETGSTLASGSLGLDGVKPTYLITIEMLKGIFS